MNKQNRNLEELEALLEWRDVVGFEGLYKISEYGDIISYHNGKKTLLAETPNRDGYLVKTLSKDGVKKACRINRLVAEAFCDNPNGYNEVNHLDENRQNNHYTNLVWVTHQENMQHSANSRKGKQAFKKKPVRCIELGTVYESVKAAAFAVDGKPSGLSAALNGARNTHRGYHWEFVA